MKECAFTICLLGCLRLMLENGYTSILDWDGVCTKIAARTSDYYIYTCSIYVYMLKMFSEFHRYTNPYSDYFSGY